MKIDTSAIHTGFTLDKYTGATAVPIYQTVSYAHSTAEKLAEVFSGQSPGYIYTRIANPTTAILEARLASLEHGIGAVATASGMAAIAALTMGLIRPGQRIVAASGIFGGTVSLFKNILGRFGVETVLVDVADTRNVATAIDKKTKIVFVETIGNPRMDIPDIPAIAKLTHKANIPLVVDNTVTTPIIFKPAQYGADIVVHSTSKFINGHGTAIGGAIIDTGNYDWQEGPFEEVKRLAQKVGRIAFINYLRNLIYRDLGACPAPFNSFLMLQGLETLAVRMSKHCSNAKKLAEFLCNHPDVGWVNYPALPSSRFYDRVKQLYGGCGGALLTFGLGSKDRAFKFINSLKLAKNLANLGDAKTLVIHPASTIFHEFDVSERNQMGITEDMIRVSVGIEDFEDIKSDFEQAIKVSL